MSVGATTPNSGIETSTAYQREKAEKELAGKGGVSKTDFLKLLTTQLTHQDPLNPSQDIDFTAQLAQLQALDEQMQMTATMKSLRTDTQIQAGTSMIGKYVSGTDDKDAKASGLVTRIVSTADGVFCELANKQRVPVENITNVWNDANSMNSDISQSTGVIGMFVEAGYDENFQPIKGIVQSVGMTKDGTVILNLFGGKSVSWSQIQGMRRPTTDEQALYGLNDAVRQQVEAGLAMQGMTVTAKDSKGNSITGVLGQPVLSDDGTKVTMRIVHNGQVTEVPFSAITGEGKKTSDEDMLKHYKGIWVGGFNEQGNDMGGIVVGMESRKDGNVFVLDTGQRIYTDAITTRETASDDTKARLHGLYAEGTNKDGEEVGGVIVQKLMVDDDLAVKLSTGEIILCKDLTLLREATKDEAKDAEEALEDAKNEPVENPEEPETPEESEETE